jgi:glutamate dehydrogenase/leucine dehydrogenase
VNRGYRIQMNSAIGPTKWTSFSPICKLKYLKVLAFEQTFKNSLHYQWVVEKVELILIQRNQIMK